VAGLGIAVKVLLSNSSICYFASMSRLRKWLSEPVFQFLLLGMLLLTAYRLYSSFSKPAVILTAESIQRQGREFEATMGRAPTDAERQQLVDQLVLDEVLFREALKAGFVNEARVRRMLIETMKTSLEPALDEPGDSELAGARRSAPEAFRLPERISFDHLSWEAGTPLPDGLLKQVQDGNEPKIPGRLSGLSNPMPPVYLPQLERMFGRGFVDSLRGVPENKWVGPIASSRGIHFVRIRTREPAKEISSLEARPALVQIWTQKKNEESLAAWAEVKKKEYRIVVPAPEPAARPGPMP